MKTVVTLFTVGLLVIAGAGLYIYLGVYDIAADTPHSKPVYALMETLRERSIAVRATDVEVPPLDDPELIAEGAEHYQAMCSGCHLAPGITDSEIRAGLYPQPPDLAAHQHGESHADMDMQTAAARQFWIVKHGVKSTGMPSWGTTHDDEAIWGLVAFLQKLPELSAQEYQVMSSTSGGHQHGGGEQQGGEADHNPTPHGGAGQSKHEMVTVTPPENSGKTKDEQLEHSGHEH